MELVYVKGQEKFLREIGLDEKWLQKQILDDPSILGLGDLRVIERERSQPRGGRIDFLMADQAEDEPANYYEVEVMLGELDPSHIIRAIEYWDIERIRFPKRIHRAVIIAEEITSRFFNVISLLNRAVPIIAIQLDAMVVENKLILKFTKVLDVTDLIEDDEDPGSIETVDLAYWEQRSALTLAIANQVRSLLSDRKTELTYNRGHLALASTGRQFAWFSPRKSTEYCSTEIQLSADVREQWINLLVQKGVPARTQGKKSLTLQLTLQQISANSEILKTLLQESESLSR